MRDKAHGRRSAWVACLGVTVVLLLGGCLGPGDGPGPSATRTTTATSTSTGGAPPVFDGEAAYAFVELVVTAPDGSPAYRVPGTPAHREAAQRIADAMAVPGWSLSWQNFTGADYAALDKGAVAGYYTQEAWCDAAERERLSGLAFSNLVAVREGPPGSPTFALAAHWDSKRFANRDADPAKRDEPVLGANDGASGVGVLLQLMRELGERGGDGGDLPFGVAVVLFDGEDGFEDCHPLAGSLWYVHLMEDDAAPQVDRLLLLDMVGDPDARFIRESASVRCDPALVDLLHDLAQRNGLAENFPGASAPIHDDHIPFTEAGVPAVDLIDYGRGFPPYWHTTHDTMENLDAGMLGRVGGLVLDVMQQPRFANDWPASC